MLAHGSRFFLNLLLLFGFVGPAFAQAPIPAAATVTTSIPVSQSYTPWALIKQKSFPNAKVEIFQRKLVSASTSFVDSMKATIIPAMGAAPIEITAFNLEPDPRVNVVAWTGGLLDVDGDGLEDLVLKSFSGGAHCCFSYTIYSLRKPLSKLGEIPMADCGDKISLEDLNQDKKLEILSCDASYTYLGKLPFAESPFPPAIYTLKGEQYVRADSDFKPVFLSDIQAQREVLKNSYKPAAALQIVLDYLLMGEDTKAWQEFDALYQGDDKENIREQIKRTLAKNKTMPSIPAVKAIAPPL